MCFAKCCNRCVNINVESLNFQSFFILAMRDLTILQLSEWQTQMEMDKGFIRDLFRHIVLEENPGISLSDWQEYGVRKQSLIDRLEQNAYLMRHRKKVRAYHAQLLCISNVLDVKKGKTALKLVKSHQTDRLRWAEVMRDFTLLCKPLEEYTDVFKKEDHVPYVPQWCVRYNTHLHRDHVKRARNERILAKLQVQSTTKLVVKQVMQQGVQHYCERNWLKNDAQGIPEYQVDKYERIRTAQGVPPRTLSRKANATSVVPVSPSKEPHSKVPHSKLAQLKLSLLFPDGGMVQLLPQVQNSISNVSTNVAFIALIESLGDVQYAQQLLRHPNIRKYLEISANPPSLLKIKTSQWKGLQHWVETNRTLAYKTHFNKKS